MMRKLKSGAAASIALLIVFSAIPFAHVRADGKPAKRDEGFDPVEFIKHFKVGMSYTEVQAALPKSVEQDILSYITTEEVFMLSVDLPGAGNWNASFKFDTTDAT